MDHVSSDPNWGSNRAKEIDYGYRGTHVTTVASKALATSFYGKPLQHAYFSGCSNGGRQAMMEVQRYPMAQRVGGVKEAESFTRLYMIPGMHHCGGGPGPNTFDMITVLENWVEKGQAPGAVIASHATDGKVDRTRPLCPFPQMARYDGTGSIDEAANFTCK